MKILKVEFENINSLKGRWTIDFTDPSFEANQNLFAICGKTGSGKSTILDAITLGIYGQTPRQGLIYKGSGNEVMTRETGNCFARVTYKCAKGVFVSEWSQRRARDNASGNLQDAQGLVYALEDADTPLFSGRTGTGYELAKFNGEKIQLDYSQFCRSIMLAQGEFSRFLTCDESDRASILEKLNGTEKYRRIAVKAGEHWSDAKAEKERAEAALNAVAGNLLSPEKVQETTDLKIACEKERDELNRSLKEIDQLLNWYRNLETRKGEMDAAVVKQQEAIAAKDAFAGDAKILEAGRRAKNCEVAYSKVDSLQNSKSSKEKELAQFKGDCSQKSKDVEKAASENDNCKKVLCAAEEVVRDNGELWNEIRKLDNDLKNGEANVRNARAVLKTAEEDVTRTDGDVARFSRDVAELKDRISRGETYLKENESDKGIAEILSGFNSQILQRTDLSKKLEDCNRDIADMGKRLDGFKGSREGVAVRSRELEEFLKSHGDDERLPQVIAESRGLVDQLLNADGEKRKQEGAIEKCKVQETALATRLSDAEANIKKIEQEQLQLFNNDVVVLAGVIQKHLEDGVECPVCGSREHPACNGKGASAASAEENLRTADTASRVRMLGDKMNDARDALNLVKRDVETNLQQMHSADENLLNAKRNFDAATEKLAAAWAPWNRTVSVETCRDNLSCLQKISDEFAKNREDYNAVTEDLRRLDSDMDLQKVSLETARTLQERTVEELAKLGRQMEESVSRWISNFRLEDCESIYDTLKKRSEKIEAAQKLFDDLSIQLNTAENNLKNSQVNALSANERKANAASSLEELLKGFNGLKDARHRMFGEQDVDSVERAAKEKVAKAKEDAGASDENLKKLQIETEALKTKIVQREADIKSDEKELAKAESILLEVLAQNGFATVPDYKASYLPGDRLESLQKRGEMLEQGLVAANQSCADTREAYERCASEHKDAAAKDVLESRHAEMQQKLEEVQGRLGEAEAILKANSGSIESLKPLQQAFDKAAAEFQRWDVLYGWFGKKNGDDFSEFVQGLTFKSLLALTNRQLHGIKGRYTLIPKGNLDFEVEDAYCSYPRAISNMSGGEKFLVSLSLALGIADFASRNVKIESLFLDEGFGTLDDELLRDVMDSLKSQHKQGKMLGVITHVGNLKDEFNQKIHATFIDSEGRSVLSGGGVSGHG